MRPEPLYCEEEDCPVEPALNMPVRILREAARMIWLEAGVEHARRGRRRAAVAATNRATALTPPERHYQSAPIHLAVGDAEGALQVCARSSGLLDRPAMKARLFINKTLAFSHLGRFDKALQSAEQAYAYAVRAESASRGVGNIRRTEALLEDKIGAAWIWAATAAKLGKAKDVAQALRGSPTNELKDLAKWLDVTSLPEDDRRPERIDMFLPKPNDAVLPAVMYVVSRAVPPTVDVEVWLDRVFHREHRRQAVRSMLARAEAARWRGDAAAEKKWQEAAKKLLGLMRNYPSALLAHFVEIR